MSNGYFEYQAFSPSEWKAFEARHAERGGRAIAAPAAVRSDSGTKQADGLVMTETLDGANRPIRTFAYSTPDHRKDWMNAYRAVPQLQLGLNKDNVDQKTFERRGKQRYAEQQTVARAIAEHGMQGVPSFSIGHALAECGEAAYTKFGGGGA
ncbi:hypothetical protein [Paraburkholderia sp. GAS348]|uniref:hypothetical protein n=1 Tax=Paraburkholderia sp. GAS348 TaxID=3035132 RepID=UPI003D203147